MELRHLRYFVGVGEEQHFGRAAERLHIAQPALSRQIKDLEKEIGFPLFERLPRGVRLSAAGKLFLEDARGILGEVQEARRRAERVDRSEQGRIEGRIRQAPVVEESEVPSPSDALRELLVAEFVTEHHRRMDVSQDEDPEDQGEVACQSEVRWDWSLGRLPPGRVGVGVSRLLRARG